MYAKVFRSLWDGTLGPDWQAWSVFVFLLAHADLEGFVDMTPQAIAGRSGIPLEEVARGLARLEAPDPNSRSQELEGRRLERIDAHRSWGWRIVNYQHYRSLRDEETLRAQTRARVRKHRETHGNEPVTESNGPKRHVEVEVEVEVDAEKRERPRAKKPRSLAPVLTITPEQREAAAKKYNLPLPDVEAIAERIEAEAAAGKYVSAPGALHTWCRNELRFAAERAAKNGNGAAETQGYTRCTLCGYAPLEQAISQQEGLCGSCRSDQAAVNAMTALRLR